MSLLNFEISTFQNVMNFPLPLIPLLQKWILQPPTLIFHQKPQKLLVMKVFGLNLDLHQMKAAKRTEQPRTM